MKKRLESELISIAHRILKLKNKSEVDQLYKETQKLYETLTVLKFYQDNFESVKNDLDAAVLEEKLAQNLEAETPLEVEPVQEPEVVVESEEEPEIVAEEEIEEEVMISEEAEEEIEPVLEEEMEEEVVTETDEEEPVFKPIFELVEEEAEEDPSDSELAEQIEPAETASEVNSETKHVALEDLLGENYVDPIFVKPNEVSLFSTETIAETKESTESKTSSLNSAFGKTMEIGLNDRVAFVNNLFAGSNEDFNRVISQLNTFDNLAEAKDFLNEMVIPDYNYWVGKEDYIERFMEVVEKKFK
jgi:hypothetical protein